MAVLRAATRSVRALITFHERAAHQVRRELPGTAQRVRVIPPGVAIDRARPPAPAVPGRGLLFLLPAGIRAIKDPDLAVSAAAAVREAGGDVHLYIAGPSRDPAFHQAFLGRLAGIPFVHYLGEVPRQELQGWYGRADVVLNTSRLEGLSNAVLEGMAAGRAVLATDIPGNRAAIRHGVDGWLAMPGNLPDAAVHLARAPDLRARLGAAARASVQERFSPQAEAAAHIRLYAEVCRPVPSGRGDG